MVTPEIISTPHVVSVGRANTQPLAQIKRVLDVMLAEPLAILDRVSRDDGRFTYLGCERGIEEKFIDRARIVRRAMLPAVAQVKSAHDAVAAMIQFESAEKVDPAVALKWLSVLFGALAKRADEHAATKLAACVDMFDSSSDALGRMTGLWKPIPKHPVVLGLTIQTMINTEVWAPAPSELRAELRRVCARLEARVAAAEQWLDVFQFAEAIVFEFDRAEWDASLESLRAAKVFDYPVLYDDRKAERLDDAFAAYEARREAALAEIEARPAARIAACEASADVRKSRRMARK